MTLAVGWSPDVQATFCATLVDEWSRCGVTDAVICPGSRSTPLALALAADDRLSVHVHHDERSGSFLALGLARATGRPVVVLTTSGTATVQLHAAVVEADLDGVPLIVCTADRPPELRAVAAPQTVDQERLYGRAARWYVDAGVPDGSMEHTWRSLAARVYAEATADWPGPVQVNLPFREPLVGTAGPLPSARGASAWHRRLRAARTPPVLDIDLASRRGIVVAGRGVRERDAVTALAGALGWPLLADPISGCRSSSTVNAFDSILRDATTAARLRPEVVIRVGGPPASKVLQQFIDAADADELVVAPERWWPDPSHRASVLLDTVPVAPPEVAPDREWSAAWTAAEDVARGVFESIDPMTEPGICRGVIAAAPPGAAVVVSSSMPVRDVEWFGPPRSDVRVFSNRGANGIDGVVSTAVGVACAGVRTTLLIGDVAFLHDVNGLLGAADRGIDLTIVVIDNDGGGIFSFLPQAASLPSERFEQLFGTPHGLDLVAVARAHGVVAERCETSIGFAWDPGVRVLVAASDRTDNVAVHRSINEGVAARLTRL